VVVATILEHEARSNSVPRERGGGPGTVACRAVGGGTGAEGGYRVEPQERAKNILLGRERGGGDVASARRGDRRRRVKPGVVPEPSTDGLYGVVAILPRLSKAVVLK